MNKKTNRIVKRVQARPSPIRKFIVVGNSHSQIFFDIYRNVEIIHALGATILGLTNSNSTTKLAEIVESKYDEKATYIFFLGQCDIEYVYYYKSACNNKKLNMRKFMSSLILIYEKYIKKFRNVIVFGINPTAILNIKTIYEINFVKTSPIVTNNIMGTGGLRNMPFEFYSHIYNDTFEKRSENNKLFNIKLKLMCKKNGWKYVDIWENITENGILKTKYFPKTEDHHLSRSDDYSKFIIKKIPELILRN